MAGTGQLLGLAGRVLAALLVLGSCSGVGTGTPGSPTPASPVLGRLSTSAGPTVVDTDGARMKDEHAEVVRSVYRALAAGDLDALRTRYAGDDWAGQAALLGSAAVRRDVLAALRTHPANLGEGYLYPGFTVTGWAGPVERADAALVGVDPATMPEPQTGYPGYQTAFFLDYDPPRTATGPLRWRGIAMLPALVTSE